MIHCPEGHFPSAAIGPHEDPLPWSTATGPLVQPRIDDLPGGGPHCHHLPGMDPGWRSWWGRSTP